MSNDLRTATRKLVLDRAEVRPQLDTLFSESHLDVIEGFATDVLELCDLVLHLLCDLPDVDMVSALESGHSAGQETDLVDSLRERRDPIGAADAAGSLRLRPAEDDAPESGRCFGNLRNLDSDDSAERRRHPHQLRHVRVLVDAVGKALLVIADSHYKLDDVHWVRSFKLCKP